MKQTPPHSLPVSLIIQSRNSELRELFAKMRMIKHLKNNFIPLLDAALQPYVDVSYDFKHTLILIIASGAIANRLRFQVDDLLRLFEKHPHLNVIKEISLKIQPYKYAESKAAPERAVALLSDKNARLVETAADGITHPALRSIMKRIAGRIK
jgi:hypothetical protein